MYWNDPMLEEVKALCDQLKATSLTPDLALATDEARWGELRSWATQTFAGAERWELWERFFQGWSSPDEQLAAIDYLSRAWQVVEPGIDGLRHEFKYRVLRGFVGQLRAHGMLKDCLLPPVSAPALAAWEAAHEVELPQVLRRTLMELSAGYDLKEEQMLFDLHDDLFFTTHRAHERAGMTDVSPWYLEALYHTLWCFERSPAASPISLPQVWEDAEPAEHLSEVAADMVLLEAYFEGNHGDHASYLITRGPLTGQMLMINDMIHAGEDGEGCCFSLGPHVADWLLDVWFFEHVLGHDVW